MIRLAVYAVCIPAEEIGAVLINNVGSGMTYARIHEAVPAEYWWTWEVNVRGTFLPTRAALRSALARSECPVNLTVINTSSVGSGGTNVGLSSYQTTKTPVNLFTEFVHFEYEAEGVRTFAYHPGARASPF
jgi:NAD(P)-dependent dehydrogenase (short-subunit alcohol dehydrogenase family)